jgi:hypothetical protein
MNKFLYILFSALLLVSCAKDNNVIVNNEDNKEQTLDELYTAAVEDAKYAEPYEISYNLIPVVYYGNSTAGEGNLEWMEYNGERFVLVSTFISEKYKTVYESSIGILDTTGSWESWVTAAPELKDFFKGTSLSGSDLSIRMKQLLGLPWRSDYSWFVEMWVRPADLFRPSADPEIDDNTAGLYFRPGTDSLHIKWINNRIASSYSGSNPYPWTRLGYTYDWGGDDEYGLSEFVLRPESPYIVESVRYFEDYVK